ncbi:MAG: FeoA family protein [Methanoregula sp.]|nr:FeoA family protein [Methanoregula sp.]
METIPLSFLPPGTEAVVNYIRAGEGLTRHLVAMGLRPESPLTVICADRGSLIVSVAGSRYALSKGMAMKILVKKIEVKAQ